MSDQNKNGKGGEKAGDKASPAKRPLQQFDARPRAQVAYEGDDEFSILSLTDERRQKPTVALQAEHRGAKAPPRADPELKRKSGSAWKFVRKIFGH